MHVRDLGPLLVEVDGEEHPVVGTKGAAMLALLTIHVNQHVSADALAEAAWGERVPAGAASTLLSHVWRLRQLLEPGRRRGQASQVLLNDAGGYRLVGSAASIDSLCFAESSARVREHLASGRLEEALRDADAALARWRGRPYGAAVDAGWARPAVARLDELRGQLQERRIAALLGLGALDTALADLRPLVAALPFHEALRALQMEALHRSGRTEQALEAYADARRTLVEEVGIEPGRELQLLHRRILDADPELAGPPRPIAPTRPIWSTPPVEARVGVHLPPTLTPLVGREKTLDRVQALVAEHRLVTVSGPAGCGKTRLAVEVARASAEGFDDGVWFVDLVGVDDPRLVVDVVISTIGFVPSADAVPLEDLKRYLGARRALVLLDNCEHLLTAVAGLVQEVLGDPTLDAGCRILVTSRERLGVVGEVGWVLDPLALPTEDDDEREAAPAVQLFLQRVRASNPTLELDDQAVDQAVRICASLDGLPLPLELAAARAPAFSLAEIADQVAGDPGRLRRPGRAGTDHRGTLRSTIDRSYRLLSASEQVAHRRLSVLPGPFTEAAAAAVLDDLPEDAQDTLVELVQRSMLSVAGARPAGPTTYRQLVTVRSHAHDALEAAGAKELEDRRDRFTSGLLRARPPLGTSAEPDWYDALDDDYATVRATLTRHLIDSPSVRGALLAERLPFYWYYRGKVAEGTRWLTLGHDLLLDANPYDLAVTRLALAANLTLQGRLEQARPYVAAATSFRPDPGERRVDAMAEALVGLAAAAWISEARAVVVEIHEQLVRWVDRSPSAHLHLLADAVGTIALAARGELERAVAQALDVQHRPDVGSVPMARWLVAGPPTAHALFSHAPEAGIGWVEQSMSDHFPFGTGAGLFIETRADFAAQQGDHRLAARLYGAAWSTTRRVGLRWPWRALSLELLDLTKSELDEHEFDRLWRAGRRLGPVAVLDGLRSGWCD